MRETALVLALQQAFGVSNRCLVNLLKYFGSAETIWFASDDELMETEIVSVRKVKELREYINRTDMNKGKLDELWQTFQETNWRLNMQTVFWHEPIYPNILKEIYDPPVCIFYRGDLSLVKEIGVAIVGTRKPTIYGAKMAKFFAGELAKAGCTIVSGMARGIDSIAHREALTEGKTIAVLGCGLDIVYPSENRNLMREIEAKGLVISEYPPGTKPHKANFPARNRIVSGLSRGVLVIEGALGSGSLITADFALEQGREVFALPGPVDSENSRGPNQLLKQGAKLVETTIDILEEYGISPSPTPEQLAIPFTGVNLIGKESYNKILRILKGQEILVFDELLEKSGMAAEQLSAELVLMEIEGLVRQLPGQYYCVS